jgi:hypothetical protein
MIGYGSFLENFKNLVEILAIFFGLTGIIIGVWLIFSSFKTSDLFGRQRGIVSIFFGVTTLFMGLVPIYFLKIYGESALIYGAAVGIWMFIGILVKIGMKKNKLVS